MEKDSFKKSKTNQDEIKVSISCLTYNHEKYIRKCLDGFVNQKTDFKFEVLIHDDASTDGTADIIKEYEQRYPNIIKPIYQTENQYSKGVKISEIYQFPRVKGKYFALCEGDDCWIDPNKLQKQHDFLENNPEYSTCVHCAIFHSVSDDKDTIVPEISEDIDITIDDAIIGGGSLVATNSIMRRTDQVFSKPSCFEAIGFGDYQEIIHSAICGKIRCFADVMSLYNCGTEGSWTSRVWNYPNKRIEVYKEKIRMLKCVDEYYEYKYHEPFEKKILIDEYQMNILLGNYKQCLSKKYRFIFKGLSTKGKLYVVLSAFFPGIIDIYKKRFAKHEQ